MKKLTCFLCAILSTILSTFAQPPTADAGPDKTVCVNSFIVIGGAPTASGGTSPYLFSWSDSLHLVNTSVANPVFAALDSAGIFQIVVTVTDANSLTDTDTVIITVDACNIPEICLVTVDSATLKNVIVWDKTAYPSASFNIYKESVISEVYDSIGNVVYDSLSIFIDTASNPSVKSAVYKISSIDSTGNESDTSSAHKTIHLIASEAIPFGVGLNWSPYEGFPVPTYRILRGTSNANITLIDSVQGTIIQYTDTAQITQTADSLFYQIEVRHPSGCTATAKAKNYNTSKSNKANRNQPTGIDAFNVQSLKIKVYPNPNTGALLITMHLANKQDFELILLNITGKTLYQEKIEQSEGILHKRIELKSYTKGIYLLQIVTENSVINKKVVIQ